MVLRSLNECSTDFRGRETILALFNFSLRLGFGEGVFIVLFR